MITKFEGTHLDWFRFWNQFEAEIDKVEISAISKFSYLKEFLVPKVRALIDGHSCTPKGYVRSKSILLAKFGKPSEVAAAHIQCIISLPVVSNSNPNKIHEFYEKLVVSVKALDTIHKLRDIKWCMRLPLGKLPRIRAELVRLNDEWQEWDFPKLEESLHKLTDRNPKTTHNSAKHQKYKRENVFQIKEQEPKNRESNPKTRACICCEIRT